MPDEKDKHDEKPQVDSKGEKPGDAKQEVVSKDEKPQTSAPNEIAVKPGEAKPVQTSGYMAYAPATPTTANRPAALKPAPPAKFSVVDAIGLGVGVGTIAYVIAHFVFHVI